MEVEIVAKKDNPLLERTDVTFRVTHPGEKTPQRGAVRDKLAATTGAKTDAVIITRMTSRFGQAVTQGAAKVYKSVEVAKKTEVPHLLKRHGLWVEPKKGTPKTAEEKAAAKAAPAPAAKAAPAKKEA
jgi:small subunit ribosomal protein S24e